MINAEVEINNELQNTVYIGKKPIQDYILYSLKQLIEYNYIIIAGRGNRIQDVIRVSDALKNIYGCVIAKYDAGTEMHDDMHIAWMKITVERNERNYDPCTAK